jgi:hypothetical protein
VDVAESIELLVTVKAYPSISKRYKEAVCAAGIRTDTDVPQWVRLYPVQFRDLAFTRRFKKYDVVRVEVSPASDGRPESVKPNCDTLTQLRWVNSKRKWAERRQYVEPLVSGSMCEILERQRADKTSLGVFRPAEVVDFVIEDVDPSRGEDQQGIADQPSLLLPDKSSLEELPVRFKYHYRCSHEGCSGHTQTIVDWELAESYRSWRRRYRDEALLRSKLRERWFDVVCGPDRDTALFVGNQFRNPRGFLVLGVFWPPRGG